MRSTDKGRQELTIGDSGGPAGEPTGLLPSAGIRVRTVKAQDRVCSLFPAVG